MHYGGCKENFRCLKIRILRLNYGHTVREPFQSAKHAGLEWILAETFINLWLEAGCHKKILELKIDLEFKNIGLTK